MDPVAPVSTQLPAATRVLEPEIVGGQNVAVHLEHKLVEYIARLQVQGGYGQEFANPAALGGEVFGLLKGYLDRASQLQQVAGKRVNAMNNTDQSLVLASNDSGLQPAVFTPGPAQQNFDPITSLDAVPAQPVPPVSGAELERAVQLLSQLLSFSFETSFIGTATTNVSKAANTLLHGQ